jgi:nitrogenase-associated protein
MAPIVFYEKPGCAGNARQKKVLQEAGYQLEVRSILAEPWTAESLLAFFADLPIAQWFNRAAPAIKSGAIHPNILDRQQALAVLLQDHLLIRRPLLVVAGRHLVGFDPQLVAEALGVQLAEPMEQCARKDHATSCAVPS